MASLAGVGRTATSELYASHLLRIKLASDASPEARAGAWRTCNRFKQIKAPIEMIVGRDVSDRKFDIGMIETYANRDRFMDYFDDPIHFAADKEAVTFKVIQPGVSFDILPNWSQADVDWMHEKMKARAAKFEAWTTLSPVPPVPDRPEDQRWQYGRAFFYVIRYNAAAGDPINERLRSLAGSGVLVAGGESGGSQRGLNARAIVIRFPEETAYAEIKPKLAPLLTAGTESYFVIDPADDTLAARLKSR